ncbi:peptidylprolyl isomerase, partial [Candidatus Peregrinibacteria bacterium]|nr:peptidylprolyl isomerase [Candidatus Peregrinibacteria bacterium]
MKKLLAILLAIPLLLTACGQPFNQTDMPEKGEKIAVLTTNHGVIKMKFFEDKAPESTRNFLTLAETGKYDKTVFHRIVPGFVIQGGDFTQHNGTGGHSYKGPGTYIGLEVDDELKHVYGAVAMARRGNDINSNGSQFYIVTPENGTHMLDGQYTVFGQVFEGMDVVEKITKVETDAMEKPKED